MKLPNGYGSITKLSGNRCRPYMVRITTGYDDEGNQKRSTLGYYAARKDALAALAEFSKNPYDLNANKATFEKIYNKWVKHTYPDTEKPPQSYISAYKYCTPLLNRPFIELKTADFQQIINNCDKGYSTKKNIKILCNLMTKYCLANDLATKNYVELTTLPPQQASRIHHPFTPEELNMLWNNAEHDIRIQSVLILCYTGMRPTEMLKIRKENINLEERYMYGGIKTAAGKNRLIPIAEKILPFIQKALNNSTGDYLYSNNRGQLLNYDMYRSNYWVPAMNMLKLDHLPHDGRHTCASLLSNASVNEKIYKLILGHASKDITERVYIHKTIQQLIDAINQI